MAKKHGGGPVPKLTPDVQNQVCTAIRAGNYIETSAAYAGISKATLYAWLTKGRRSSAAADRPYREFVAAVERALAEAEVGDVARIKAAAEFQWQASAWRLERKYPERWGRKSTVQFDNDKAANESLTSLITASMANDPAYADRGKGFAHEPDSPADEPGRGSDGEA